MKSAAAYMLAAVVLVSAPAPRPATASPATQQIANHIIATYLSSYSASDPRAPYLYVRESPLSAGDSLSYGDPLAPFRFDVTPGDYLAWVDDGSGARFSHPSRILIARVADTTVAITQELATEAPVSLNGALLWSDPSDAVGPERYFPDITFLDVPDPDAGSEPAPRWRSFADNGANMSALILYGNSEESNASATKGQINVILDHIGVPGGNRLTKDFPSGAEPTDSDLKTAVVTQAAVGAGPEFVLALLAHGYRARPGRNGGIAVNGSRARFEYDEILKLLCEGVRGSNKKKVLIILESCHAGLSIEALNRLKCKDCEDIEIGIAAACRSTEVSHPSDRLPDGSVPWDFPEELRGASADWGAAVNLLEAAQAALTTASPNMDRADQHPVWGKRKFLPETPIANVQNPAAAPHPAPGDTVHVAGIVTAFDLFPSSYGFYLQNSNGQQWSGLKIATDGDNTRVSKGLAVGDSVCVVGRVGEFAAETLLQGPDLIFSTNDLIVEKIVAGPTLPRFHYATTSELEWRPGISATTAEPWEGSLVAIRGPLRLERRSVPGAASPGLPINLASGTGSFLCIYSTQDSVALPTDTLLVDLSSLAGMIPPAIGTVIDSVRGVLGQGTSNGINSYRVQPRGESDLFVTAPPNLVDGYPVGDSLLRLVFDRDVDAASAEDPAHYALGSGIDGSTVDGATVVGGTGRIVELSITSVRSTGDQEVISAADVGAAACPTCLMSPQQARSFIQGVLTIADVQSPDPLYLGPACEDRSRFAGPGDQPGIRVTIRGVSSAGFGSLEYLEDGLGAVRGGISLLAPIQPTTEEHRYLIAAAIQELGGETGVVNTAYMRDDGPDALSDADTLSVATAADSGCDSTASRFTAEDYEGKRVTLSGVRVSADAAPGEAFVVVDTAPGSGDSLRIDNAGTYSYDPAAGDLLDVTGILRRASGRFVLSPRSNADIAVIGYVGVQSADPPRVRLIVHPNPARSLRVSFDLPSPGTGDLAVFDLAGRRIATLAQDSFDAGRHSYLWDGRSGSGANARAGVYLVRLRFGGRNYVRTAIKLE